jgi:hypothetical protein
VQGFFRRSVAAPTSAATGLPLPASVLDPLPDSPLSGEPSKRAGWPWKSTTFFVFGALASFLLLAALLNSQPEQNDAGKIVGNQSPTNPVITGGSRDVIGRVNHLESQVILERKGSKHNAVVGMDILVADSLDVPAGGGVDLTLADHSQAKLGPRTIFSFASAQEATLREGFVQIDTRNRQADVPLAINTPDAKTKIREAWLSMGADRKRTQIRVAEGSVLASRRGDGMSVEIPEGYCSTIAEAIDPGPRLGGNGTALLVVSTKSMMQVEGEKMAARWERFDQVLADRILGDRLWRSATPVRVRTYDELRAEDLENCAIIVLSVFPLNAGVEQKLADLKVSELPVPIICLETTGFPLLGLTGEKEGTDFGFDRGPLVVDIAKPGHPLAARFVGSGLKLFAYTKRSHGWGRPAENALSIAHVHQRPDHWMLFAYEQGDLMARGTAPARRVGLFIIPAVDYDAPGFDLVDAAIDWCLDSGSHASIAEMVSISGPNFPVGSSLLNVGWSRVVAP